MAFKIKKVRPLFTGIITTATKYQNGVTAKGGLLLDVTKMDGTINNYQIVKAVGSMVHDIKEGDVVCINFKRYLKVKHLPGVIEDNVQSDNMQGVYEIPKITIDDTDYLFIQNNDIEYVVEDYEVDAGGLLQ